MKTQKQLILNYLKQGKSISQRKAIAYFNIIRLSAVIYDLKKDGYEFEKINKKNVFYSGSYSEYKLKIK